LTGLLIRTLVAVTAPVESALPHTLTQRPTFNDFAFVDFWIATFVFEPTVMERFVVEPFEPNCRAAITIVEPDTDETVPVANAPAAGRPGAPDRSPVGR
jgi:hypothetical protein